MSISLPLRNSAVSTIMKKIKERHSNSRQVSCLLDPAPPRPSRSRSQDFVTDLYDHNGKMTSFNLENNSGLYSKLMGLFNVPLGQFVAQTVRVKVEDLLRPFIVANKSFFF